MAKKHGDRFVALVDAARAEIRECSVDDVRSRRERGDALNVLDVREESEWAAGHIPGARHLGKGIIERDIEEAFPDTSTELILYCGGGYRSALAALNLRKMGYPNVVSMDGGYRAWTEAGLPVDGR